MNSFVHAIQNTHIDSVADNCSCYYFELISVDLIVCDVGRKFVDEKFGDDKAMTFVDELENVGGNVIDVDEKMTGD